MTAKVGHLFDTIDVRVRSVATNVTINGGSFTIDDLYSNLNNTNGNVLAATVLPTNYTDGPLTWRSQDTNLLTIDNNGRYTPVDTGVVKVWAIVGGVSNDIDITINQPVTNITIPGLPRTLTLNNGVTLSFTAQVLPSNHTSRSVEWAPNGTASFDGIPVYIIHSNLVDYTNNVYKLWFTTVGPKSLDGPSPATIRDTQSGAFYQSSIIIRNNATNFEIDQGDFTVSNGFIGTLTNTTVYPTNHGDGDVVWSSSDTSKFPIDSNTGAYLTLAGGNVTVTATVGPIVKTIEVSIVSNPRLNIINTISLDGTNFYVNRGGVLYNRQASVLQGEVLYHPAGNTDFDSIVWSSSDSSIVSVVANTGAYTVLQSNAVTNTVWLNATLGSFTVGYPYQVSPAPSGSAVRDASRDFYLQTNIDMDNFGFWHNDAPVGFTFVNNSLYVFNNRAAAGFTNSKTSDRIISFYDSNFAYQGRQHLSAYSGSDNFFQSETVGLTYYNGHFYTAAVSSSGNPINQVNIFAFRTNTGLSGRVGIIRVEDESTNGHRYPDLARNALSIEYHNGAFYYSVDRNGALLAYNTNGGAPIKTNLFSSTHSDNDNIQGLTVYQDYIYALRSAHNTVMVYDTNLVRQTNREFSLLLGRDTNTRGMFYYNNYLYVGQNAGSLVRAYIIAP